MRRSFRKRSFDLKEDTLVVYQSSYDDRLYTNEDYGKTLDSANWLDFAESYGYFAVLFVELNGSEELVELD